MPFCTSSDSLKGWRWCLMVSFAQAMLQRYPVMSTPIAQAKG